jgi:HAMP domain-containing protein
LGDFIIAHAPIGIGQTLADRSDSSMDWAIALSFPRKRLFEAVFNLYLLYGVLALTLVGTAIAGFLLSRHLLRPLEQLSAETGEISKGNFAHRVEIRGEDEIADLGRRFNAMAARLEQTYRALEDRKGELEKEVQIRTTDLEKEQQERRELDRQMFPGGEDDDHGRDRHGAGPRDRQSARRHEGRGANAAGGGTARTPARIPGAHPE